MNKPICNDPDVLEYMVTHGNAWVSQENLTVSNPIVLFSYLEGEGNVREVIKIEGHFYQSEPTNPAV